MKKKNPRHHKRKPNARNRNAAAGFAAAAPRPRARTQSSRAGRALDWKTIAAAVAGGAGSAALGGLVVN